MCNIEANITNNIGVIKNILYFDLPRIKQRIPYMIKMPDKIVKILPFVVGPNTKNSPNLIKILVGCEKSRYPQSKRVQQSFIEL